MNWNGRGRSGVRVVISGLYGVISRSFSRNTKNISKAKRKRIPLNSKWGNKNYYKGKGAAKSGRLTRKGRERMERGKGNDDVG